MCLLVLAWQVHPRFRLVLAGNRDEYHARPTAALAPWDEPPRVLAGRDLQAGGTWLGVDRARRVGVVTNFRELARPRRSAPSRGRLVPGFLGSVEPAETWLRGIEADAMGYAGFNLLLADHDALWYASNRADEFARRLDAGVYGLANRFLDTPWPKLARVRARFEDWLLREDEDAEALFALLADTTPAEGAGDGESLAGRVPPDLERALAAPFVRHPEYGTRCTTVVLLGTDGALSVTERRFDPDGRDAGRAAYRIAPGEWP